jgi:hypothetical protein
MRHHRCHKHKEPDRHRQKTKMLNRTKPPLTRVHQHSLSRSTGCHLGCPHVTDWNDQRRLDRSNDKDAVPAMAETIRPIRHGGKQSQSNGNAASSFCRAFRDSSCVRTAGLTYTARPKVKSNHADIYKPLNPNTRQHTGNDGAIVNTASRQCTSNVQKQIEPYLTPGTQQSYDLRAPPITGATSPLPQTRGT